MEMLIVDRDTCQLMLIRSEIELEVLLELRVGKDKGRKKERDERKREEGKKKEEERNKILRKTTIFLSPKKKRKREKRKDFPIKEQACFEILEGNSRIREFPNWGSFSGFLSSFSFLTFPLGVDFEF